mgnify:FL=1|tara:strand:- start:392 stop:751 length:360 start_codon:yes stop_codon:yes gene_type:complete
MMDIWVVIDRYEDMMEVQTHVHMTPKGAYVKAYQILHEVFDNLCDNGSYGLDEGDVSEVEQTVMKCSRTLYDMVMNNTRGWDEEKLADMEKHFHSFASIVHDYSEYSTQVSIEKGRLRA